MKVYCSVIFIKTNSYEQSKFNLLLALLLLVISGVYCTKHDIKQDERNESNDELTINKNGLGKYVNKGGAFNFKAKQSDSTKLKHNKEKALPITNESQSMATTSNSTSSIGCNTLILREFYGNGYHSYPLQELNFSNIIGGTVAITVTAYGVPNNFIVRSANNQIVAQSGWLGNAAYSGPWGTSLNSGFGWGDLTFEVSGSGMYYLEVETYTESYSDYWEASITCQGSMFQNGNRIKFPTIYEYEMFANNELDRNILINLASSSYLTTLAELDPNDNDETYPEFLEHILNQDKIVEMGSFLVKVDALNQRVLAINSSVTNAYQTLVADNLNAQGLIIFHSDVSNGIEILELIEEGILTASDYQSAIETSSENQGYGFSNSYGEDFGGLSSYGNTSGPSPSNKENIEGKSMIFNCTHAPERVAQELGGQPYVWDSKTGNSGCPDNLLLYKTQPKVYYQKFIIYYALKSRMNSFSTATCSAGHNDSYQASLRLVGTAKYKKRCGAEQLRQTDFTANMSTIKWKPYEGSESLSAFDFSVSFDIKHINVLAFTNFRTHSIMYGY